MTVADRAGPCLELSSVPGPILRSEVVALDGRDSIDGPCGGVRIRTETECGKEREAAAISGPQDGFDPERAGLPRIGEEMIDQQSSEVLSPGGRVNADGVEHCTPRLSGRQEADQEACDPRLRGRHPWPSCRSIAGLSDPRLVREVAEPQARQEALDHASIPPLVNETGERRVVVLRRSPEPRGDQFRTGSGPRPPRLAHERHRIGPADAPQAAASTATRACAGNPNPKIVQR